MAQTHTVGGYGQTADATKETQDLCHQVKTQVEKKTGKKYVEIIANEYRRQDGGDGINFLIKVHVGGEDYIHLIIFQDLGEEFFLHDVLENQTKISPLQPF
ncbi:cystatin-A5-like isoform X2 [Sander lucioperca]|uniref:cystatin-A5-like isoform X2 n=1 Tax=Sander lucioperca TaxID=283035 RepID=UPI0016535369|nr:cystatin-A5-like isoform X2 [Sander lucioperca]